MTSPRSSNKIDLSHLQPRRLNFDLPSFQPNQKELGLCLSQDVEQVSFSESNYDINQDNDLIVFIPLDFPQSPICMSRINLLRFWSESTGFLYGDAYSNLYDVENNPDTFAHRFYKIPLTGQLLIDRAKELVENNPQIKVWILRPLLRKKIIGRWAHFIGEYNNPAEQVYYIEPSSPSSYITDIMIKKDVHHYQDPEYAQSNKKIPSNNRHWILELPLIDQINIIEKSDITLQEIIGFHFEMEDLSALINITIMMNDRASFLAFLEYIDNIGLLMEIYTNLINPNNMINHLKREQFFQDFLEFLETKEIDVNETFYSIFLGLLSNINYDQFMEEWISFFNLLISILPLSPSSLSSFLQKIDILQPQLRDKIRELIKIG